MRLRETREARGLSQSDLAQALGLSDDSLWDLEAYDQELYSNLSLAELRRLATVLDVEPAYLLAAGRDSREAGPIGFGELTDLIRAHLASTRETAASFSESAGWDVEPALTDPKAIWNWCPDGLRDVCEALGVDWIRALPSQDPPASAQVDA